MKKLLALSYLLFIVALCTITSSPLPLLFNVPSSLLNWSNLRISVDVSTIAAYADEHKRDIINSLVNGLDIANDITVFPNVKNTINLTKLSVSDGTRPYSAVSEPKANSLGFTNRTLTTRTGKRDLLIDSRVFKNTHLAWRSNASSNASKDFNDMDFAPFTWMKVIEGLKRDVNDQTAYFGFDRTTGVTAYTNSSTYAIGSRVTFTGTSGIQEWFEATASVAINETPSTTPSKWLNGTSRAIVPGIKSYIDTAVAGGFAVTATGIVSDGASARAACKKLYRDFSASYKNQMIIIHGSYTDYEFLTDGQETITQYTTPDVAEFMKLGLTPIFGTNDRAFFKPATWLGTSRRLIAEPMEPSNGGYGLNLAMGTDLLSDLNNIEIVKDIYTLKAGLSFDLGFQIQDLSALRLGNQS